MLSVVGRLSAYPRLGESRSWTFLPHPCQCLVCMSRCWCSIGIVHSRRRCPIPTYRTVRAWSVISLKRFAEKRCPESNCCRRLLDLGVLTFDPRVVSQLKAARDCQCYTTTSAS
eukprot:scaffold837_cov416-Prasinococcus_capsulatus_cf.AAC.8